MKKPFIERTLMDGQKLERFIKGSTEKLNIEYKNWFCPDKPSGIAKILKACIAMRNHNGGFLIIGVDNQGVSQSLKASANIKEIFEIDKIQGIVSQYSSEKFEIELKFPIIDNNEIVVIIIPSGVRSPVCTIKPVVDNSEDKQKNLVNKNMVFCRTLSSNNTPSTSIAGHEDFVKLTDICFDNREVDIARFFKRHLPNISAEKFTQLKQPKASLLINELLFDSESRIENLVDQHKLTFPEHGYLEAAIIVDDEFFDNKLNKEFLNLVSATNPKLSGFELWMDSRTFPNESQPNIVNGFLEAFIFNSNDFGNQYKDYWRVSPHGKLYFYRGFFEDLWQETSPNPLGILDFDFSITQVAEALAVSLRILRELVVSEDAMVNYKFRWYRLNNRKLSTWSNNLRMGFRHYDHTCLQNKFEKELTIPISTTDESLVSITAEIITELFNLFSMFQPSDDTIEKTTRKFLRIN